MTSSSSPSPVYMHGLTVGQQAGLACGIVVGTIAACAGAFYYYNHTKVKQLKLELQKEAELRKIDKILEVAPPEPDVVAGDDKVRLTMIRTPVAGATTITGAPRHKYYDTKPLQPASPAKSSRPQSPHVTSAIRKGAKQLPPVVLHSTANAAKPLHSKPKGQLRALNGAGALFTTLDDHGTSSTRISGHSELHSPSHSPGHSPESSPQSKTAPRSLGGKARQ
jgi:hypothetical protein